MSDIPLSLHQPTASAPGLTPVLTASEALPRAVSAEQRVLSVLFADVSNSSALYAAIGDVRAKAVIDTCFARALLLLPKFDGRLVKTIGDAVMCTFPTVDQAVLAASEMQVCTASQQFDGYSILLHIGVHYGRALVSADDVHGDTVNVAGYLTAIAGAGQIVASEAAAAELAAPLKHCVRPVYRAFLKGSQREAVVYQVIWAPHDGELTETSIQLERRLPPDMGALVVEFGEQSLTVNAERPRLRIGRASDCDLVVRHPRVSRHHLLLELRQTNFHLVDKSINGTWVTSDGRDEALLLRCQMLLPGAGVISLGCPQDGAPERRIIFRHDRRSAFRLSDAKAEVLPFVRQRS